MSDTRVKGMEEQMRGTMVCAALLASALVAAGCAGTDATAPSAVKANAVLDRGVSNGAEQRVTGSAFIILPWANNAPEQYSVSAIRHADGTVSGELEEFSAQDGGQRVHATIACFTVVGNTARLAAKVDRSTVPFGPVGTYVIWTLVDNGQGKSAPPDLTTDLFFGGDERIALFHCNAGVKLDPFFPSLRGNLQVDG